jgi:hypothetical protein
VGCSDCILMCCFALCVRAWSIWILRRIHHFVLDSRNEMGYKFFFRFIYILFSFIMLGNTSVSSSSSHYQDLFDPSLSFLSFLLYCLSFLSIFPVPVPYLISLVYGWHAFLEWIDQDFKSFVWLLLDRISVPDHSGKSCYSTPHVWTWRICWWICWSWCAL